MSKCQKTRALLQMNGSVLSGLQMNEVRGVGGMSQGAAIARDSCERCPGGSKMEGIG